MQKKTAPRASLGYGDYLRFSKLLLGRYGLYFSERRRPELESAILHAFAASPTADFNEYYTLLVEQADSGQGMSPEHLSRLFEPFFTTKEKGAGMGLSVSYDLIKQYDGDITVTSQPGQGTTFTVWLHTTERHE